MRAVYRLYALTEEEMGIVEGERKPRKKAN